MGAWSFLTNHAHVLLCLAADPHIRLRDIADNVGVTEGAAHRIVSDLVENGYVSKRRVGRRNYYEVHADAPLRRVAYRDHTVGELLEVLVNRRGDAPAAGSRRPLRGTASSSPASLASHSDRRRENRDGVGPVRT